MNIKKLLISSVIVAGTCMSISTASHAGNPAAYSCLKGMAQQRAYTNADVFLYCLNKKPVWRMLSWENNGRVIKPSNPMTPTAFNKTEVQMCGNPCE